MRQLFYTWGSPLSQYRYLNTLVDQNHLDFGQKLTYMYYEGNFVNRHNAGLTKWQELGFKEKK